MWGGFFMKVHEQRKQKLNKVGNAVSSIKDWYQNSVLLKTKEKKKMLNLSLIDLQNKTRLQMQID